MRDGNTALVVIETMKDISSSIKRIIRQRRVPVCWHDIYEQLSGAQHKNALDHVEIGEDCTLILFIIYCTARVSLASKTIELNHFINVTEKYELVLDF